jgi:hypothetical protein
MVNKSLMARYNNISRLYVYRLFAPFVVIHATSEYIELFGELLLGVEYQ